MLRVLSYTRVDEIDGDRELDPAHVSATPETFRAQMTHLARRYAPVSLEDVLDAFTGGATLPPRAVHVTFDDAYRNFAEVAWPILRELGIPVTLFVPTAYPGSASRSFWWDRMHRAVRRGAPTEVRAQARHITLAPAVRLDRQADLGRARALLVDRPHDETELLVDRICATLDAEAYTASAVLSWDELRRLHAEGVAIGAHTHHHVALTRVPETRMRWEIRRSLDDLLRELGQGPAILAYPYGMVDGDVLRVAHEEGCVLGFSTTDGLNRPGMTHPLLIRRTCITLRTAAALFPFRLLPWLKLVREAWPGRRGPEAATALAGAGVSDRP